MPVRMSVNYTGRIRAFPLKSGQMQTREQQLPATRQGPRELETPRLTLRRLVPDDAAFYLALVTDPAWIRFIGDKKLRTVEEARRSLVEGPIAMYGKTGHGLLCVERREDGVALGICGLIKRDTLPDVDIGFAFLPAYRGQGHAAESARAVLAHGRDDLRLPRVVAITSPQNTDSRRLLERLGLVHEKTYSMPGESRLTALYAIDWR
jgi:RimJ/RimL family protein N-acetyltransferase